MKRLVAALFALALFAIAAPASARSSGSWNYNSAGRGGGTWQGFSPTWLPGLLVWCDGNQGITLNSTTVSSWACKGVTVTQATTAKQPTYTSADTAYGSHPSLSFSSASSQVLTGIVALQAQPMTIGGVGQFAANGAQQEIFGDSATQTGFINRTTNVISLFGGTFMNSAVSSGSPAVLLGTLNGASSALYINSRAATVTGNANTQGWTGTTLGVGGSGALANFLQGKVAEIFAVNRQVDAGEIARLVTYEGAKFRLAVTP